MHNNSSKQYLNSEDAEDNEEGTTDEHDVSNRPQWGK